MLKKYEINFHGNNAQNITKEIKINQHLNK